MEISIVITYHPPIFLLPGKFGNQASSCFVGLLIAEPPVTRKQLKLFLVFIHLRGSVKHPPSKDSRTRDFHSLPMFDQVV